MFTRGRGGKCYLRISSVQEKELISKCDHSLYDANCIFPGNWSIIGVKIFRYSKNPFIFTQHLRRIKHKSQELLDTVKTTAS